MEPDEQKMRVGRPAMPKNEKRHPGVSFRLTIDESKAFEAAIKEAGLGKSDYAKKCLLYVLKRGIRIT